MKRTVNTSRVTAGLSALSGQRTQRQTGLTGASAFIQAAKPIERTPIAHTWNGAISNATTLSALLDFFSGNLRGRTDILRYWEKAKTDDKSLARRLLFQTRDVRGGKGERDVFRTILKHEALNDPAYVKPFLALVPEYGRWDDLWCLLETPLKADVIQLVKDQLMTDLNAAANGQGVTGLAKWLPTENAGKASSELAGKLATWLNLARSDYRKICSLLRQYLNIVERHMSNKEWGKIAYPGVPSRAMKLYRKAFGKHDQERFAKYLQAVLAGKTKINAATVDPHEIMKAYDLLGYGGAKRDDALEAQWLNLPKLNVSRPVVAMCDTSGSMSSVCPAGCKSIDVALALTLYFAQQNKGEWAGLWFNFSENAHLNRFNVRESLINIVKGINMSDWGQNTNFQAMFDTVLTWYDNGKINASDIPAAFICFSDMQFDVASGRNSKTNLQAVKAKFEKRGLVAPTLVFWNVAGATDYPAVRDDSGVILLSGFNVAMFKAVMSMDVDKLRNITPAQAMLDTLLSPRYDAVA